jgi:hypothetical protein
MVSIVLALCIFLAGVYFNTMVPRCIVITVIIAYFSGRGLLQYDDAYILVLYCYYCYYCILFWQGFTSTRWCLLRTA